jgi:hypothetical protein
VSTKGRFKLGPRHRPSPSNGENKTERAARLTLEAERKIAELERRLHVSRQATQAAIRLLTPYAVASPTKGGRQ